MFLFAFDFGAIIPIIFLIIWVISQVAGGAKQQPAARRQQQPRRRKPDGQAAAEVDDEIQQFLRDTADQRGDGEAPDVQLAEPIVLERADVEAQPLAPSPAPTGSRLSSVDTSEFTQRTSQLGAGVRAEESQNAARRQQLEAARSKKFDKDLGQLEKTATVDRSEKRQQKKVPKSAAAGIAAMLADGESLRDAIVFSEIINRPSDRW
ncbi:MAG: hypothetical protein MI757_17895 [Pirellulales bacterium]|nr:hypothetical protein [Pirellulales bacterium]